MRIAPISSIALSLGVLLGSSARAEGVAAESPVCRAFDESIENALMTIASEDAGQIADNSAPRATLAAIRVQNQLMVISANLQLKKDNGCAPDSRPLLLGRYMLDAMKCQTALMQAKLSAASTGSFPDLATLPGCDRSKWVPIDASTATSASRN